MLRQIRKRIADANDIPYEITECNHKGDCSGTCPKCDAEIRWLEFQLMKRKALGKPVTVEAQGLTDFVMPDIEGHTVNDVVITDDIEPGPQLMGEIPPEPRKTKSFLSIKLYLLILLVLLIYVLIRIVLH